MMRGILSHLSRRWQRQRRRWPLTRQIAILFAGLMMVNALLLGVAFDFLGTQIVASWVNKTSPRVQSILQRVDKDNYIPTNDELKAVEKEFTPQMQQAAENELNALFYLLIAVVGLITMLAGYLFLGRVGRGLTSVADAAQQIAHGDLAARAAPAGFVSREETQLIGDFNAMAAALQRADREMAENSASIAHELRTPLTILRGRLHGIADGVFALEPQEVQALLYQVEGLSRLVDDLQTLSLAHSHRLILARENTDLAKEADRVITSIRPDLEAAGLNPRLDLRPAPLLGDGTRLRQVIAAVLTNAARYAKGSGDLTIATRSANGQAVFQVVDQGPGLPDGADELAFERFWRGEASRNRETGGSGLGLSVVRAIVQEHGGSASLANGTCGGVVFTMWLPSALSPQKLDDRSIITA